MKLELYYFPECPYCQIVLDKINDLKINEKIDFKNTRQSAEAYQFHRETTGRSTVPCLYIDDKPMFESLDIIDWLDKHFS
jgi:glutaredoxin